MLVVLDSNDKVIYPKRLLNDGQSILGVLAMYKEQIVTIALVDFSDCLRLYASEFIHPN